MTAANPSLKLNRLIPKVLFCIALITSQIIGLSAQGSDDVISVDSSLLLVNATVTDKRGVAVNGLTAKQFILLIDGVEQKFTAFEPEITPYAAVILLDTSGSMETRVSLARSAAIKFLEELRSNDIAAIVQFNTKVEIVQDFSNSRDIVESIFDVKADGMTALNDAVARASAMLAGRPEKRKAILLLSDGGDTLSKYSTEKALKAANAAGATIYTVDMSSPEMKMSDRAQLQAVLKKFSEKTGGTFVAASGGPLLREALKKVAVELGNQYTLSVDLTEAMSDGKYHTIEVRINKPDLTIRTRKGYTAPKK